MANNGQTFASLNANSLFYNSTTAIVMLLGRFGLATSALLLAGRFASQTSRPMTPGKLRTDSVLFALVVIFTALIVVGLTYFAALAPGPMIEQLQMAQG
jgi:K+-transporting ATPase ATPase A chain